MANDRFTFFSLHALPVQFDRKDIFKTLVPFSVCLFSLSNPARWLGITSIVFIKGMSRTVLGNSCLSPPWNTPWFQSPPSPSHTSANVKKQKFKSNKNTIIFVQIQFYPCIPDVLAASVGTNTLVLEEYRAEHCVDSLTANSKEVKQVRQTHHPILQEVPPGSTVVAGEWTFPFKVTVGTGIKPFLCKLFHSPGAKLHWGRRDHWE